MTTQANEAGQQAGASAFNVDNVHLINVCIIIIQLTD